MACITLQGFTGSLSASIEDASSLALTLLLEGYGVDINGLAVMLEFGPGYDTVIWAEGHFAQWPVLKPTPEFI